VVVVVEWVEIGHVHLRGHVGGVVEFDVVED